MKNKTSFGVKTLISRILVSGMLFAVLLSPSVVFGQGVHVQAYSVSSVDVWSNGVILKGTTDTVNYRWFEFGVYNTFSSFTNSTPKRWYDGGVNYMEKISGLSPETSYIFRAVAEINGTRFYGRTMTFKTKEVGYTEPVITGTGNYSYTAVSSFGNGSSYQPVILNNQNTNTGNTNYSNTGYYYVSSNTGYPYTYSNSGYNYNSYLPSSIVTKRADFLSYTSARLNANLFPSSEYNVYGWFEWGTTPNLGSATSRVFIGKGPSLYFGQILSGLVPGTTYYFKPVIENVYGAKVEGTTLVFKTTGVSPYQPTIVPADTYNQYNYTDYSYSANSANSVKTPSTYGSTGTIKTTISDPKKTIRIEDPSNAATVIPGEKISKKVIFENVTGEDLTHVSVRVILPDGETFVSSKNNICTQIAGQVLFCDIGKMANEQKTEISYEIEAEKSLNNGISLEIITIAAGEYQDGRRVENFLRTESVVDASKENTNMAAAALFGNTDSSVRDMFIFIEFVLLLVLSYFVWKHLSEKNKKEETHNLEALNYLHQQEVVIPQKQNEEVFMYNSSTVNEKGIPPTNLPV